MVFPSGDYSLCEIGAEMHTKQVARDLIIDKFRTKLPSVPSMKAQMRERSSYLWGEAFTGERTLTEF